MDYDGAIEQVDELANEVNQLEDVITKLEKLVKDAYIEGLVVDDDEVICDFFTRILTRDGYQVTVASNGQKALNIARERRLSLVLLDIRMPGMDGVDTLRELKKINKDIPVIMLSAYGDLETNIKAARLGAHNCIAKPFDLGRIKGAIEEAIEKPL